MNEAEKLFIWFFRQKDNRLLNLTEGGEGISGYFHSPESKKKMSDRLKELGVRPSKIALERASATNKLNPPRRGKKATPDMLIAMSKRQSEWIRINGHPMKGRKMSAESLEKIKKARAVRVIRSDGLIFDSIPKAAEAISADLSSVHDVLSGHVLSLYGFSFAYLTDNYREKFSKFGIEMYFRQKRIARRDDIRAAFSVKLTHKRTPFIYKGVPYKSTSLAQRASGIPKTTFFRDVRSGKIKSE